MILLLCFFIILPTNALLPSLYWRSSPVNVDSTALFAGSFGNTSTPTVAYCLDATCTQPISIIAELAYERSVAF